MRLSDLQYELPTELIAQHPVEPRDASRLLVLDRETSGLSHHEFRDIAGFLRDDDCLVVNDTEVIQARFWCRRATGGRIEALFLHESDGNWRVLLKPSSRLKVGEALSVERSDVQLELVEKHERGEWAVRPKPEVEPITWLDGVGQTPLPPYILRDDGPDKTDLSRYQTVYAQKAGAVAAPTAGLHFTPELLGSLESRGIKREHVTLHVGIGTFQPVSEENLADHDMHSEWFDISAETLERLAAVRRRGGRIVAVGTTSARVLESVPFRIGDDLTPNETQTGWTDIFIYPPYEFKNVDAMITNFHLPGSTLMALVMALASADQITKAYKEAIESRYRFYSYGDAMFIM